MKTANVNKKNRLKSHHVINQTITTKSHKMMVTLSHRLSTITGCLIGCGPLFGY